MSVIECEHGKVLDWGAKGERHYVPEPCPACEQDAAEVAPLYRVTTLEDLLEATRSLADADPNTRVWFRRFRRVLDVIADLIQSDPEVVESGVLDAAFPSVQAMCEHVAEFVRAALPEWCDDCAATWMTAGGPYKCARCANLERLEQGLAPYIPASLKRAQLYGITESELQRHLNRAGGHCEICDDVLPSPTDAQVDHNHLTGEVRGVLCRKCNHGLGVFGDDPDRLLAASEYLTTRGYYGGVE